MRADRPRAGGRGHGRPTSALASGRFRPGGLAVLLGLAAVLGCAGGLVGSGGAFERHFEAGRYRAAVDTFEADSSLQRRETPLFRAGLVYAAPGDSVHDPERARDLLSRLLELHPGTEYRHEARALLALLEQVREAADRAVRLQDQLQRLKKVHLGRPPDTSSAPRR